MTTREVHDPLAERIVCMYVEQEMSIRAIIMALSIGGKRVMRALASAGVSPRSPHAAQEINARKLVEGMNADSALRKRVREWGASAVLFNHDFRPLRQWPSWARFDDAPVSVIERETMRIRGERLPSRALTLGGSLTGNSSDLCAL